MPAFGPVKQREQSSWKNVLQPRKLVATLGSKSTLKKVDRKAINNVDVPKACAIIIEPQVPMALRLQSNLLFGVTRVYFQQCGYVLEDAKNMQNHMRHMLRNAKLVGNELDSSAVKTKPDALLLQDDPSFLPEFALDNLVMDIGFSNTDLGFADSDSQLSSLLSSRNSQSSRTSVDSEPRINVPTSDNAGLDAFGALGGYDFGGENTSQSGRLNQLWKNGPDRLGEGDMFLPEVDFAFDEEGNMYETAQPQTGARQLSTPAPRPGGGSAISAAMEMRHGEATGFVQRTLMEDYDVDQTFYMEDDQQLPDAEAFPERNSPRRDQQAGTRTQQVGREEEQEDRSSEYAVAPQRRRKVARKQKPLPMDREPALHTAQIRDWSTNYAKNMQVAASAKQTDRTKALSKKNAKFYVWGRGIGDLGRDFGTLGVQNLLDFFYGDKLKDAMMGITREAGQKRDRRSVEEEEGSDESERRVRARGSQEVGRGEGVVDGVMTEEDGMGGFMEEEEPEIGRTAPTPLAEDGSTIMPWNLSAGASQRSSILAQRQRLFSRAGSMSSQLPLQKQQRRLTSASPLIGRGSTLPPLSRQSSLVPGIGQPAPGGPSSTSGFEAGGLGTYGDDERYQMPLLDFHEAKERADEFERFGPAANVDTQVAAQASWVRHAMDAEADNFLAFVETAIAEKIDGAGHDTEADVAVAFEELLPPAENSKIVAAQGLLHCLSLATKGVLSVRQEEHFGEIRLSVVVGEKAAGLGGEVEDDGAADDQDGPMEDGALGDGDGDDDMSDNANSEEIDADSADDF